MRKQVILRGLLGFPLGVFFSYTITILISLMVAHGEYAATVPGMAESVGSSIGAVVVQYLLSGLLGAAFAAGSVIWENDTWSISKRTGLHFLVTAGAMFPIAYVTHWMEHTILGALLYVGIFVAIYVVIWVFQWWRWSQSVQRINKELRKM